jgi:hypothetical protein
MAKAIGTVRSTDLNHKGQSIRCSSGGGMTFTSAKGLGAVMIADLETAIANAKAIHRVDRITAARERLADRVA